VLVSQESLVASNPGHELQDLAAVHKFFVGILEPALGHPVPVPGEVARAVSGGGDGPQSVATLKAWLNLLDMAIAPPMVRDALKESTTAGAAESLLRYFVQKRSRLDVDRDKTDFVATYLYRTLIPPEKQQFAAETTDEPSEFEEEIYQILGDLEAAPLPEEHRQLVREFPFLRQEVEEFRHFDELMDSGVMQRVREMKQRFGPSFYHPRVLATSAQYNVFFGQRFDELFRDTTQQLKQFAANVQQQGGSILARVDGDVTVKHLADVEETVILQTEYGRAQEQFRKISKFKKAVDSRRGARPAAAAADAPPPPSARAASAPAAREHVPAAVNPLVEEGKVRNMLDSIRTFVAAADPKSANVVPLRNANLVLAPPELDAFRADYAGEKSFRGEYAQSLRLVVSVFARIVAELEDYNAKQNSAYLWKPHADSLAYLLAYAQRLQEQCGNLMGVAQQRGLTDKVNALNASLQRLRGQVGVAARALQAAGAGLGK
jgi:hypothetical protein